MEVEPWASKIELTIPEGVNELVVNTRTLEDWTWAALFPHGKVPAVSQGQPIVLPEATSTPITITAANRPRSKGPLRVRGLSLRAGLRRVLTECRDRLAPVL
ncbi:MAG: hypothetical protein ACREP9_09620, partial [Candidatus Dormibacteraceae bacterium]